MCHLSLDTKVVLPSVFFSSILWPLSFHFLVSLLCPLSILYQFPLCRLSCPFYIAFCVHCNPLRNSCVHWAFCVSPEPSVFTVPSLCTLSLICLFCLLYVCVHCVFFPVSLLCPLYMYLLSPLSLCTYYVHWAFCCNHSLCCLLCLLYLVCLLSVLSPMSSPLSLLCPLILLCSVCLLY